MKRLILTAALFGILGAFLASCRQSPKEGSAEALLSPISLAPDSAVVHLRDYFPDLEELDELRWPEGVSAEWDGKCDTVVVRVRGKLPAFSILSATYDGQETDLLLRRSEKVPVVFRFDPAGRPCKEVNLTGDMNAWNGAQTPMDKDSAGVYSVQVFLAPGTYAYLLEVDGKKIQDPANADRMPNGMGAYNSRKVVPGAKPEEVPDLHTSTAVDNRVQLFNFGAPGQVLALWNNRSVPVEIEGKSVAIHLPKEAESCARSYLRVYSASEKGFGDDLLIPLEKGRVVQSAAELKRSDPHRMVMYFLMVDRFFNAEKGNDKPTPDPEIQPRANFHGGDLAGVNAKLQEGYFSNLGMNTIWISPISRNPDEAWGYYNKGGVRSKFSSYHGYWPVSLTRIDSRFGTDADLDGLVGTAHEKDMNVLLDFVAHHVHQENPVYREHKQDGWTTDLYLPDGSLNTERWDDHRLTTWFDTFLPTWNFQRQEISEIVSDSALYWLERFGLDGFRHDATKHIPLNFWRTNTLKVKSLEHKRNTDYFQIGETYGSPELIGSYISSGMLDAQFDFNLYDALVSSLFDPAGSFVNLAERIRQSQKQYGGHHLMGNMSGNQDKVRAMSLASGEVKLDEDGKLAGWTRRIDKQTKAGFRKLSMMHAINMTLPGIPVVYYGDEIGMPGGNDPDNRRMMRFQGLSAEETALKARVAQLAKIRAHYLPLLYGDTRLLLAKADQIAWIRDYFGTCILLVCNKKAGRAAVDVPLPEYAQKLRFQSLLGRERVQTKTGLRLELEGWDYDLLIGEK